MRLPTEQIHLQVAQNLDLAAIAMAEIARDRRPHQIPVQEIERDDHCDQEGQQDREGPADKTHPGEGKIPEIPNYPVMPDMVPTGDFRVSNQGHSVSVGSQTRKALIALHQKETALSSQTFNLRI